MKRVILQLRLTESLSVDLAKRREKVSQHVGCRVAAGEIDNARVMAHGVAGVKLC
jgi:hypothetical protein